ELLPLALRLGDGDEVRPEKDAAYAVDPEQSLGERRLRRAFGIAYVERSVRQHGPARQEFERRRIRCRFGLNDHGQLRGRRSGDGRWFAPWRGIAILIGGAGYRKFKGLEVMARYDMVSRSASLRWPGTMPIGIGNSPADFARLATSGPGPSLPTAAASTSTAMSSSSSISLSSSSAFSPSRITRSGMTPVILETRAACRSSTAMAYTYA